MPTIRERWRAFVDPAPTVYRFTIGGDAPTQVLNYTARKLYQTQDNLQAVVNFLADSIAQLPLKVYKREDETVRVRDRDSAAAKLLWKPNADQTCYEFVRALLIEYYVFGTVFVWVLPDDSDSGYQLRIVPSEWLIDKGRDNNGNAYAPSTIRICTKNGGTAVDVPASEFVQFRTYSAGNPGGYISPISALRSTLTEQIEAGNFRKELWHSSGRLNAQIIRPKDVAPWDDEQRSRFVKAFRESWGPGGTKAGSIPLLEDGMEIKPFSASFKESQWAESVKLSRESVAAAYHVNPSLIWHTDSQTYASSKDNARALYAECLGPVIQMVQQRFNSMLLPMVGADDRQYVEFDMSEKLRGSFEERASIMQSAVGGPWLTRNEARAMENLPPIDGGDELIVPLNVVEGGLASPNDTDPTIDRVSAPPMGTKSKREPVKLKGKAEDEECDRMSKLLQRFFKRQASSVLPKLGAKANDTWWNEERWNTELADDLYPEILKQATAHGIAAGLQIGWDYNAAQTEAYLRKMANSRSEIINASTRRKLQDALDAIEETEDIDELPETSTPQGVFAEMEDSGSERLGGAIATAVASWAITECVNQAEYAGSVGSGVMKTWIHGGSSNQRSEHLLMDGETVPFDEPFSNGMMCPGDSNFGADENAYCQCEVEITIP